MSYMHGYSARETQRLFEQSLILERLLHEGTRFPDGSRVLEPGCGVGAQTSILARKNPGIKLTSMDISGDSMNQASRLVTESVWKQGLKDIRRVALHAAGTFFYTWFKGEGTKEK